MYLPITLKNAGKGCERFAKKAPVKQYCFVEEQQPVADRLSPSLVVERGLGVFMLTCARFTQVVATAWRLPCVLLSLGHGERILQRNLLPPTVRDSSISILFTQPKRYNASKTPRLLIVRHLRSESYCTGQPSNYHALSQTRTLRATPETFYHWCRCFCEPRDATKVLRNMFPCFSQSRCVSPNALSRFVALPLRQKVARINTGPWPLYNR